MRPLFILALLLSLVAPAQAATDATLKRVLELAGVQLLCEQTAPLLQRGMSAEQQKSLGKAFAAVPLCDDLAKRAACARHDQNLVLHHCSPGAAAYDCR